MDTLEQILRETIGTNDFDGGGSWSITNTSVIVGVKARTSTTYATVDEAFAAARELLGALADDTGYVIANRADIGVTVEAFGSSDAGWRGTIDACFGRPGQDVRPIVLS